ncbi:MAG TPA: dephospho-CoA kinase [Chitinophagales bacterium]|nr:dephospho-CoA kinase [Chitinophagales bacterium]HMU69733.1 dephospho-CoA kinase [Chitinophagales bacterium]HMZ89294.1 dephospho-CoA kinase [Chitinophagales bacterium]HNA57337.1 dephospho-CoA kinase [Chitinophagales bacterium]HNE45898.1 dephospho-CoA kinase [Chitinophagales bacterium]
MIKVGITGGIGSGKSTVCKIFEVLGVPVYYADERAKEILQTDAEIIKRVKDLFGEDVYDSNHVLDRKRVAFVVFHEPEFLAQYNKIIHPAVLLDSEKWMQRHLQYPYVIKEAALLFESGGNKQLDKVICVTAPEDLRIQRVMQRDNTTEEQVRSRMANQMSEEEKLEKSDFILYNDGSAPLIRQVLNIHEKLLEIIRKQDQLEKR